MEPHHTIQLEAFNTPLHGAKILYCLPPANASTAASASASTCHPPWSEWISKLREPFRKKIRLSPHLLPFSTRAVTSHYDATFDPKEVQDWTLILTYITYAPKPLLVVVEDLSIPDGLWQKLTPTTTLLHLTRQPIVRLSPYDAIFFAPMEEVNTPYAEYTHRILQAIHRPSYTAKEHKEVLQELRVARAGLTWTRVNESAPTGSMYWYDPVPAQPNEQVTAKQLVELFSWLTEQFQLQGGQGGM
jgi:hypothetical protein